VLHRGAAGFAQAKLVERERLAVIAEFAATVVRNPRKPLTTVMMGLF